MTSAYTTWALDDAGRNVRVSEPQCPSCSWGTIPEGDCWVLGEEILCRAHAGLQAAAVLEDALSGDEVPPRVLRDACEILRILIARSGGSPSGVGGEG